MGRAREEPSKRSSSLVEGGAILGSLRETEESESDVRETSLPASTAVSASNLHRHP